MSPTEDGAVIDDPAFQAGYRAALAHLANIIATDPLAASAEESYRAAVDIEALETRSKARLARD